MSRNSASRAESPEQPAWRSVVGVAAAYTALSHLLLVAWLAVSLFKAVTVPGLGR